MVGEKKWQPAEVQGVLSPLRLEASRKDSGASRTWDNCSAWTGLRAGGRRGIGDGGGHSGLQLLQWGRRELTKFP